MEYTCPLLGAIIYDSGIKCICELGICEKKKDIPCQEGVCKPKKSIKWNDIDSIYIFGEKRTVFLVPATESLKITVIGTGRSSKRESIAFKTSGIFKIGKEDKEEMLDIYTYIISKVIDRQRQELNRDIKEGKRVSFESFDITSTAIYRKKLLRGYEVIELSRIVGCDVEQGEFFIEFIDDKGNLKRRNSGQVYEIPNIHLAEDFILRTAQHNIERGNVP